jgi:hypothetical protein
MSPGSKEYVDGMLVDWGAAFFNQGSVDTGSVGRGAKGLLPAKSRRKASGGTLTKRQAADAVRGKLRAVANRSPEVMIKFVAGAPRGMRQIKRALDYISRKGEIPLEEQDGLVTQGKEELSRLKDDWQNAGAFIDEDEGKLIQAYHLVLSMPEGTDELGVKRAVRDFAAKELDGHLYVMAQHTFETDPDPQPSKHPHVHLVVKVRSDQGKRLNPRKNDLQRWRETYAQALRDHGIDAAATRRLQRFKLERAEKQAVRQIRDSGRKLEKIGKSKADPERVQHAKLLESKAIEVYRQLCTALGNADDVEDRRLALGVLNRLAEDRGVALPTQRVERQAKRDREGPQR